jgi:hypothetical protein
MKFFPLIRQGSAPEVMVLIHRTSSKIFIADDPYEVILKSRQLAGKGT